MVTNTIDNVTYHLADLDGTRIVTPVEGKQIKAFKKRQEAELDPALETEGDVSDEEDE